MFDINVAKVDQTSKLHSYPLKLVSQAATQTLDELLDKNEKELYNNPLLNIRIKPKRSTLRSREFWKKVKADRARIISAVILSSDNRLYTDIIIEGTTFKALLDSGATVSCLGGAAAKTLAHHQKTRKCLGKIRTASNESCSVIAKLLIPIRFQDKVKEIEFFLIPELKQDVYLGVDFWQNFGLLAKLLKKEETVGELDTGDDSSRKEDPKMHLLTEDQKVKLGAVIKTFPSFEREGLGRTSLIEHSMIINTETPVKQRHWPISPAKEKWMFEEVEKMIALDVIEPSKSPWSSNCVLVKKGNKNRLCLDSREINRHTRKDAYPLPHIDGILSRLPPAKYITGLDMKHAYWQIPLAESSRPYTAFTIPNRPLYQYKVMPFGLTNAAQTLCRLMDQVIPAHLRTRVFVYLDDLLVLSDDFESHLMLLREVAVHLRKANLTINVAKSHFCMQEIKYLGFIIGYGQLKTDPGKIKAIEDFPIPKSVKQLRRFLGLCAPFLTKDTKNEILIS